MSLQSLGRTFEKQALRPFFRRLRKALGISHSHDRVARLEQRIEHLESLFREQAGLHYLRLVDDAEASADTTPDTALRRETA
jgi:hypothetical protein